MRYLVCLPVVFALTACSGSGSDRASSPTRSGISSNASASLGSSLSSRNQDSVSNAAVGTVVYVNGVDRDDGQIVGLAGIVGTPTVGAAVTADSATYDARYEYFAVDNVSRSSDFISGQSIPESGSITLEADFVDGTLTGIGGELTVNGTIDGTDLGGTVTANYELLSRSGTVDGRLDGSIGTTGVIGAFAGDNSDTVLSGGFVGTRR